VWAVRACGARERARARERERRAAERRGEGSRERDMGRETASPMVLHCVVGEEVAATFGAPEDLFPEGSLFMSLRAIGYLLTHAACLLSVRFFYWSLRFIRPRLLAAFLYPNPPPLIPPSSASTP